MGYALVCLEELVKLCHSLRLPAGEGHIVLLGEAEDVVCHSLIVVLDHALFIEKCCGAVADLVEEVASCPVEYRHEVVADNLNAELCNVADALLVVFDVFVACREADFDVIVNVDRLDNIHVEAVLIKLALNLGNLLFLPDFARHLVVKRPDDTVNAGDLLDIGKADFIVAFAVPAESHFHNYRSFCSFSYIVSQIGYNCNVS